MATHDGMKASTKSCCSDLRRQLPRLSRQRRRAAPLSPAKPATAAAPKPAVAPRAVKSERKRNEADARNKKHRDTRELKKTVERIEKQWEAAEARVRPTATRALATRDLR